MTELKNKLDALLKRPGLMTGAQLAAQQEECPPRRAAPGAHKLAEVVPGEVIGDDDASFYLVRTDHPLSLEQGVAYFEDGVFRLDQCFMRDFDEEEPMLEHLDTLFKRFETVVSYNGKSFDLPLLRTRFIQNRLPFRLEGAAHLDLVHVARRFYKRRLKNCSLGNIEREVLHLERHGDVPGHLIPRIWFDYIDSGNARALKGVFYHHRMDILSLVALTGWLSQCLEASGGAGFEHAEDRLSVVRIHYRQKEYDAVIQAGGLFLESTGSGPLRRECFEMLGFAHKRRQHWEAMQAAWERLLEEFPRDHTALLELAKHHEHRTRNLARAKDLCETALESGATARAFDPRGAQPIRHRLARIQRKLGTHNVE